MGIITQYAIFRIIAKNLPLGQKELAIEPVNELGNTTKVAVFSSKEDAEEELKKLIYNYSSTKFLILPIYGDSMSAKVTGVRI